MGSQHEHYPARQQRIVVWGCRIHRTQRGEQCQGCADQGELITWSDIQKARRQREQRAERKR